MDRTEQVVDEVIAAYQGRRLRLWLANFSDLPEGHFGEWGGLVQLSAESYLGAWQPPREALVDRLRRDGGAPRGAPDFDAVADELLPLAREGFARDLAAKRVPPKVAEKAKDLLLPRPPVQQWKM